MVIFHCYVTNYQRVVSLLWLEGSFIVVGFYFCEISGWFCPIISPFFYPVVKNYPSCCAVVTQFSPVSPISPFTHKVYIHIISIVTLIMIVYPNVYDNDRMIMIPSFIESLSYTIIIDINVLYIANDCIWLIPSLSLHIIQSLSYTIICYHPLINSLDWLSIYYHIL